MEMVGGGPRWMDALAGWEWCGLRISNLRKRVLEGVRVCNGGDFWIEGEFGGMGSMRKFVCVCVFACVNFGCVCVCVQCVDMRMRVAYWYVLDLLQWKLVRLMDYCMYVIVEAIMSVRQPRAFSFDSDPFSDQVDWRRDDGYSLLGSSVRSEVRGHGFSPAG
jgi:hypothetical protein